MNKYVLLCAAFLSSLTCLMNAEGDRKGKDLAADMMKKTMKAADENAAVRSCSSCCKTCGKCKTCKKCCCKSMMMSEEDAKKSCGKCCSSCGKCCGTCKSCKSAMMDETTKCNCGKPKQKSEEMEMENAA
jgi:hypothetical protein